MSISIRKISSILSRHFPSKAAESWDNPGLQVGHRDAEVARVLVALELTQAVIDEAVSSGAGLVVTHHPFIFKPMKAFSDATADGRMLLALAEKRIGLFAAHTNLDAAPCAIADRLADDLGLTDRRPVLPATPYAAYKITAFVPESDVEAVAAAMHAAGAGCVGNYADVSFRAAGLGYFACGEDSNPAYGFPGQRECVREVRLEMVVSERDLDNAIRALVDAHPYEEPAYDVFRLENPIHGISDEYGFGTVGTLPEPTKAADLIAKIKQVWDIPSLRAAGDPEKVLRTVAIMNGAGAKYMTSCGKIDAYISGDCGHHDFDRAHREGIVLIDAGHYDTEKCIPQIIADTLRAELGDAVEIVISTAMANPMRVY